MLNFKNLLMITTVSLLASSGIINHHKLSNNLQQINSETIICNNSYQSLNNSTILSNKDSFDNYHIYDINNVKTNDNLVPYINQLTVNNEGELVFDKEKIPDAISEDWNNAVSQDREEEQIVSAAEGTKILQKQNLSKIVTSAYTSSSTDLHWTLLQFGDTSTQWVEHDSVVTTLLKWNNYADSWENFMFLYPNIFAYKDSEIDYNVMGIKTIVKNDELNFNMNKIHDVKGKLPVWRAVNQPPSGHKSQGLIMYIYMWHDNENIYQQFTSNSISRAFDTGTSFTVKINNWTINNFIKEN